MPRRLPRSSFVALAALVLATASLAGCTSSTTSATVSVPTVETGVGQPTPFLGANLVAVGCGASLRCATVGNAFDPVTTAPIATSADGGITWHAVASSAPGATRFTTVACSATSCMAVGRSLLGSLLYAATSTTAGWKATSRPETGALGETVGCAARQWCMAIFSDASHVWATTTLDAGATWTTAGDLPAGTGSVRTLSCTSPTTCIAVGTTDTGGAQVTTTHDGGATWAAASLPASPTAVSAVSAACRLDGTCLAIVATSLAGATTVLSSSDGGATFAAPTTPILAVATPLAVACASATCVLVGKSTTGDAQAVQLSATGSVRSLMLTFAPTPLTAVSCASAERCVALSSGSLVVLSLSVAKRSQQQTG